jgi:peptidase C39-like protein
MWARTARLASFACGLSIGLVMVSASVLYLVSDTRVGPGAGSLGWVSVATSRAPIDNQGHLYVLDGWGGVHPVGASPELATTASWPTKDIAFSLALFPDATGGYVMDGWGRLHPLGMAPAVDSGVYWPHWIGARQIVMAPWSSSAGPAGYLLDADGGIHPFAGAPAVWGNATWPGKGIARGLVLISGSTPESVRGYTLDGYGGVHPFGGAPEIAGNTVWTKDVARGLVLTDDRNALFVQGYTLDYSGAIHAFGGAPGVKASVMWPGRDVADSIVAWTGAEAGEPGGWVLDRQGGVHEWGSAPHLEPSVTWPGWDIARGLAGAGSGGGSTENLVLEKQASGNDWGAYFNQRDARWASRNVGHVNFTVSQIGCLISALAMVYSHFGDRSVTPATIAANRGWFDGRGAMYNSALNIPGHTTVIKRNPSAEWIRSHVSAGHPVIVGMNLPSGTTHFLTLTGTNGASDYWVNDPWEQNAMHVTFTGDWFTRGPIYEAFAFI